MGPKSTRVSGRGRDFGDRLTSVGPRFGARALPGRGREPPIQAARRRVGSGDAISGLSRACVRAESVLLRCNRENDGTRPPTGGNHNRVQDVWLT